MKALEDESRRLKRMFADLLREALGKSNAASSVPRIGHEEGSDEGDQHYAGLPINGGTQPVSGSNQIVRQPRCFIDSV